MGRLVRLGLALAASVLAAWASTTKPAQWDGSRVTPVHQIPLKDEFGQTIVPTERHPLPFSARWTCAPCHDYDIVRKGWHFDAGQASPPGRPGEPWVLVDERTGTQIPVSFRPWKGSFPPSALGLSGWDFTLLFGRHFPGGGVAEPAEEEMAPGSRWGVSGRLEVNCLGCHNARRVQNPSEWAKQILRENFRWAATAASGLGEVGGMSSRLDPTWDIFDGPNPDDTEWAVPPSVRYDRTIFDAKHRAFLDIAARPDDARCLACHAAAPTAARKFDFEEDVHTAAGLACVSCHRHDLSHAMIRGYEGEGEDNPAVLSEDFSCRGCHLGGRTAAEEKIMPGRLGAPTPKHNGLPKVHLDRLSCTACHSGPLPAREPERVRTSRANRLGIYGVANWVQDMPAVFEPVYLRDTNGKLTPHRLFWPAYWGKRDGKTITPLPPAAVLEAAGEALFPERAVTRILAALFNTVDLPGVPLLVMDGKSFEDDVDAGLDAAEFPGAKPGELWWGIRKDGQVAPLVPDFDPANAEAAADPEIFIQKLLEALRTTEAAPGEPVIVHRGFQYKIVESQVEKADSPEDGAVVGRFFWLKDGRRLPFVPEFERRTIVALANSGKAMTEEQVRRVLETLGGSASVYLAAGKVFKLDDKDALKYEDHQAAEPVAWPLAHQVRPARQSLGIEGCTDCHRATSDFFFAEVRGQGPLLSRASSLRPASAYMDLTAPYHLLFGTSFAVRPYFKIFLGAAAVAIGSVLLAAFLLAVGRWAGLTEKGK